MKRVLTAVVLIPVVLLLLFKAPWPIFVLAIAAIVILTLREYLDVTEAAGLKPFKWLTVIMALVPFALQWLNGWPVERQYKSFSFDSIFLPKWLAVFLSAGIVFGVPLVFRKDLKMGLSSAACHVDFWSVVHRNLIGIADSTAASPTK